MASNCVVVGMDLGTSNSCVAVYRDGDLEVLRNEFGYRTVSSVVGFFDSDDQGHILVGESALQACEAMQLVSGVKRIIGTNYFTQSVEKAKKYLPYDIVNDNGNPAVKVRFEGEDKLYSPEKIMSEIMKSLKSLAEEYLGENVTRAVVTVPAYYSQRQRQATMEAAELAGIEAVLLKEPVAAAMSYGLEKINDKKKHTILVYDLGAGTLDVTIMSKIDATVEVKAVGGNNTLGGDDFTNTMMDVFVTQIKEQHGQNVLAKPEAKKLLRDACERLKKKLSNQETAKEEVIRNLLPGLDFHPVMTRSSFEKANLPLFQATIEEINQTLDTASIKKTEITDIVLVGGSTRIPLIREMIAECFHKAELIKGMFPEEAVVRGAAIHAASIFENQVENLQCITLLDVVSLSLRVGSYGGVTNVIVPRNTPIPCSQKDTFITVEDNQTEMSFPIYEGERKMTADNILLGRVTIKGLRPAPRGEVQVELHVNVDQKGVVHVKAVDWETGKDSKLVLTNISRHHTEKELRKAVREAQQQEADDHKEDERVRKRVELRNLLYDIMSSIRRMNLDPESTLTLRETNEMNSWLESESGQDASKEEYEERIGKVNKIWHPEVSAALEESDDYASEDVVYYTA